MLFTSQSNLSGKRAPSKGKNFQFAIYDDSAEIEDCTWYRLKDWSYPVYYLRWRGSSRENAGTTARHPHEEEVVGVAYEGRAENFLILADQPEFRMHLKREPDNAYDHNAIKVMGSAVIDGQRVYRDFGYLAAETAKEYAGKAELQVGDASVLLPFNGRPFSLRLQVLERSHK